MKVLCVATLLALAAAVPLPSAKDDLTADPSGMSEPSNVDESVPGLSSTLPLSPMKKQFTGKISSDRMDMAPGDDDPLDDDCDSPQLGDIEETPQGAVRVQMNEISANVTVPEQDDETRETLSDVQTTTDHPSAGTPLPQHPSHHTPPGANNQTDIAELPPPDAETAKKLKCSKNTNGHDVPDALDDMGDDCGMPEPEIPCETPGNSTACPPRLYLPAPTLPAFVPMPSAPVPNQPNPVTLNTVVAIEFVDFGLSHSVAVQGGVSVNDAIALAQTQTGTTGSRVQSVRNAGAEVPLDRKIFQLEDTKQLIVYLLCTPRDAASGLIVRLPFCEDLGVKPLAVRVEVPETDDVFFINAVSTDTVGGVMNNTPLPPNAVAKITYNGARLSFNQTLEYIHYANNTVLVVYLTPNQLPYWSEWGVQKPNATGSDAPVETAAPSGVPTNASDDQSRPAPPAVPVPAIEHDTWPRPEMSGPALVTVHIQGDTGLNFPILLQKSDVGSVIHEAIHARTGAAWRSINVSFHNLRIERSTPLAPFGFVDGDTIPAQLFAAAL